MTPLQQPTIQIKNNELAIVLDLLKKHVPDYTVLAFGSRVGGTPKTFSDLDLVLVGPSTLPLATRAELNNAFSESDLPWKVDLVDWHSITPAFQEVIRSNFISIYPTPSTSPNK